jgi:hypothetical protein
MKFARIEDAPPWELRMTQEATFGEKLLLEVNRQPGATDRALSKVLGCRVQQVNNESHHLQNLGILERRKIGDEPIGNWPVRNKPELRIV